MSYTCAVLELGLLDQIVSLAIVVVGFDWRKRPGEIMSDKWLYRIYGQEFGPVSLDLVRTLVAAGTIAPDDEVRDATRSNWILACAASELRDSISSPKSDLAVDRRAVRDEWFCRGAAGDFGPLKLIDLIQLAAEGGLRPDEEIKATSDDYWKQVSSIRRLVELLPFAHQAHNSSSSGSIKQYPGFVDQQTIPRSGDPRTTHRASGPSSLQTENLFQRDDSYESQSTNQETDPAFEEADVIQFPGRWTSPSIETQTDADIDSLTRALAGSDVATSQDAADPIAFWDEQNPELESNNSRWTGWVGGKEFGPVSYSTLLKWAVTGRLSPMDFVRQGDEASFIPAVNVPSLFTVRAAANASFRRTVSMSSVENAGTDSDETSHNLSLVDDRDSRIRESDQFRQSPDGAIGPSKVVKPGLASLVTRLVNDRNSMGLSAVVVISIVVLVWAAGF